MSWKENIGRATLPDLDPETVAAGREFLRNERGLYVPIDYYEDALTLGACALDSERGGERFRSALTDARNNSTLMEAYNLGALSGKGNSEHWPNHGPVERLYKAIRDVVQPRIGRYRIDMHDSSWRIKTDNGVQHQNYELKKVVDSNLSEDMQAILLTKMFLVYTSASIKYYADTNIDSGVLEATSMPEMILNRWYQESIGGAKRRSGQRAARNINKGFASHAGFYEALSGESNGLLRQKVGEGNYDTATRVIETALWLVQSKRSSGTSTADVRDHKFEVFRYVDSGDISSARDYLVELYKDEPEMFSNLAIQQLFGEDGSPPTISSVTEKIRPDYKNGNLSADLCRRYCAEEMGLSEEEIAEQARRLFGRVIGIVMPETDDDKKQNDLLRIDGETHYLNNPMLKLSVYRIGNLATGFTRDEKWRRMSMAVAVACLNLGRFVDLGSHSTDDMGDPEAQKKIRKALQKEIDRQSE